MRFTGFVVPILTALAPTLAHACDYGVAASAQAQVGYAPAAALAAPSCSYEAAAVAAPAYAPAQAIVLQRQVVAQPVYVQRQVVLRQQAYAPVVQQQVVSPYAVQAQAAVGYGGAALAPSRGLAGARNRGLLGLRGPRTVAKSRSVVRSR